MGPSLYTLVINNTLIPSIWFDIKNAAELCKVISRVLRKKKVKQVNVVLLL